MQPATGACRTVVSLLVPFAGRSNLGLLTTRSLQLRNTDIARPPFHLRRIVCRHSPHLPQKRRQASPLSPSMLPYSSLSPLRLFCQLPHLPSNQSGVPPQAVISPHLRVPNLIPDGIIIPSMTRVRILSIRFRTTSTEPGTKMVLKASPRGYRL